ncbi:ornithine cyclodeaminase family protein [Tengunoibacter tsumagoiensis]|uniref:Ornithine cyclodeaminase n=1 Tax=Tengunoibacter tsumagoiensis TaxID=2014871 RepID=A0A402A7B2_9CHLR|nr:ornithine cyclodeaminase family protein [Tengunoibacter tsumagoiensis]GCE14891.1 ornithine cyclodeaminase [Tengunoibacter tsumagoiensis]
MHEAEGILYLCRREVEALCQKIDSVAIIREMFRLHGNGESNLPDEAYLGWRNIQNEPVRSLNMPGYLGGPWNFAGTKIINGNIANPKRGLPRANGLTILYDPLSVRPLCIMEGAYLSSLRTASVSALAVDLFYGRPITCLAIIGAGVLAQAHIELLLQRLSTLQTITIFDTDPTRITALQQTLEPALQRSNVSLQAVASAEDAIRSAQLIIPTTTTTTGYIQFSWLQPGAILVNISLDDALPEVFFQANLVVVDDWKLVKNDSHRMIGRLYREGLALGPDEAGTVPARRARKVDAEIGDIVVGTKQGRKTAEDIILVNPFGLAIEDIALAGHVYQLALEQGLGMSLER